MMIKNQTLLNELQRLREQNEILRIEKEQIRNDALFHRKKADEYLRQLTGGITLEDWLRR